MTTQPLADELMSRLSLPLSVWLDIDGRGRHRIAEFDARASPAERSALVARALRTIADQLDPPGR